MSIRTHQKLESAWSKARTTQLCMAVRAHLSLLLLLLLLQLLVLLKVGQEFLSLLLSSLLLLLNSFNCSRSQYNYCCTLSALAYTVASHPGLILYHSLYKGLSTCPYFYLHNDGFGGVSHLWDCIEHTCLRPLTINYCKL